MSAARLAAAMREAVQSEPMRLAAAEMGQRLRAEDGVARAVEWLQRWQAGAMPAATGAAHRGESA